MKKHYVSILLTLASLIGFGVRAVGQEQEVVVTVPFDFVVSGRTLPAGQYTVSRLSDDRLGGLSISSFEKRVTVFVLANQFENERIDNSKVTFEQVEGVHYLRSIESRDGVYTIGLPRVVKAAVAAKEHDSMSASGTN